MKASNVFLCLIVAVGLRSCKPRSGLKDQLENQERYDQPYGEELFTVYPNARGIDLLDNIMDASTWLHHILGEQQDLARRANYQKMYPALEQRTGLWDHGREQFRFLKREGGNAMQKVVAYDFFIKFKYTGTDERSKYLFQFPFHYRLMPQFAPNASRFFQVLISAGYYNQSVDALAAQKCIEKSAGQFSTFNSTDPSALPPNLDCYKKDPVCCFAPQRDKNGQTLPLPNYLGKLPLRQWGLTHVSDQTPLYPLRASLSISNHPDSWNAPFSLQCDVQEEKEIPLTGAGASGEVDKAEALQAKAMQERGLKQTLLQIEEEIQLRENQDDAQLYMDEPPEVLERFRQIRTQLQLLLSGGMGQEAAREQAYKQGRAPKPVAVGQAPNPGALCQQYQGSFVWPKGICNANKPALPGFGGIHLSSRIFTMPTHDYVNANLERIKQRRYQLQSLDLMMPVDLGMSAGGLSSQFARVRTMFEGELEKPGANQGGGSSAQAGNQARQKNAEENSVLQNDSRYQMSESQQIGHLGRQRVQDVKAFVDQQLQGAEQKQRQRPKTPAEKVDPILEKLRAQADERVRTQERMRLAVRPDGFQINPYANEAEYYCNYSEVPPAPFARFQGLVGGPAQVNKGYLLEAFAKALALLANSYQGNPEVLKIEKIDWLRTPPCKDGVCSGPVKYALLPTFNQERK